MRGTLLHKLESHLSPSAGAPVRGLADPDLDNHLTLPPQPLVHGLKRCNLDGHLVCLQKDPRLGMTHDSQDDFDHPRLPRGTRYAAREFVSSLPLETLASPRALSHYSRRRFPSAASEVLEQQ